MTRFDTWLTTQQELPETCPQCDGDNSTEDGEWVAPDAIPFCSTACQTTFDAAVAESERRAMTCPTCHLHYDEHTTVIVVDPEYGDYETVACPTGIEGPASFEESNVGQAIIAMVTPLPTPYAYPPT